MADVGVQGEGCFLPLGLLGFSLPSNSQPRALSCLLSLPFCTESTGAEYEFRVEASHLRISPACGRSWAPPLSKKGRRMKLWILLGSLSNKVTFCTEDGAVEQERERKRDQNRKKKNTKKLRNSSQLRIHTTLAEDTGSQPYTRQLKTSFKSSPMGFNVLLWPPKTSTSTWCVYTHSETHIHVKFFKK